MSINIKDQHSLFIPRIQEQMKRETSLSQYFLE